MRGFWATEDKTRWCKQWRSEGETSEERKWHAPPSQGGGSLCSLRPTLATCPRQPLRNSWKTGGSSSGLSGCHDAILNSNWNLLLVLPVCVCVCVGGGGGGGEGDVCARVCVRVCVCVCARARVCVWAHARVRENIYVLANVRVSALARVCYTRELARVCACVHNKYVCKCGYAHKDECVHNIMSPISANAILFLHNYHRNIVLSQKELPNLPRSNSCGISCSRSLSSYSSPAPSLRPCPCWRHRLRCTAPDPSTRLMRIQRTTHMILTWAVSLFHQVYEVIDVE